MRQKGFRKIIILSSTLVIIIVALIILLPKPIYWYPDNQTTPISSKPISKYQNKISNGIYTNDFAGFSIKPPIKFPKNIFCIDLTLLMSAFKK